MHNDSTFYVRAGLFVTSRDNNVGSVQRGGPVSRWVFIYAQGCCPRACVPRTLRSADVFTASTRHHTVWCPHTVSAPWPWSRPPCPRRSLRCAVATKSAGVISWRRLTRSANSWTGLSQMRNVQRWATLRAQSAASNRWEGCYHQQRRGPVRRPTELAVWRTGCSFCGAVSLSSRTCAAKQSTRAAARCEC